MKEGLNVKEHIFKQYPYRIELHAHTTPASSCSNLKPEELVQLYHEKGYDGLVITNHFDPGKLSLGKVEAVAMLLRDYQAAKETAKKYGLTALRCKALPEDSFQLAQILKTGDYVFEIGTGSLWIP